MKTQVCRATGYTQDFEVNFMILPVLHYFAESPFYDPVSNNGTIQTQAQASGNHEVMETRTAFEAQLDKMYGLEYRVAYGPKQFGTEAIIGQGRWVIRKQQRNRGGMGKDEVIILESYFVIGESIFQAPALEDIVWARIVSAPALLHLGRLTVERTALCKSQPDEMHEDGAYPSSLYPCQRVPLFRSGQKDGQCETESGI